MTNGVPKKIDLRFTELTFLLVYCDIVLLQSGQQPIQVFAVLLGVFSHHQNVIHVRDNSGKTIKDFHENRFEDSWTCTDAIR